MRNLALTSRRYFDIVKHHAAKRVFFWGSRPAVSFFERNRRSMHAQCGSCSRPMVQAAESMPEGAAKPLCVSCLGRELSNAPTRLEQIQELYLSETLPLASYKVYHFTEEPRPNQPRQYLISPPGYNEGEAYRNPDDFGSNLIGATISICPNLKVLYVTNTPIPVKLGLTRALTVWCTKLRDFTYVGKAFDTVAMAQLVHSVSTLEALHVSSVKTCDCQGETAAKQAVELLGRCLRSHAKLTRLTFTACRALRIGNGRLLDILSAPIVRENAETSDAAAPADTGGPDYGVLKLESFQLRRCPVPGPALSVYLSSPNAAHLKHLCIGGCKYVKAEHLAEAVAKDTKGLIASDEPLDLDLDADLISKELFKGLQHRIRRLRLFEPTFKQYCILTTSIEKGYLPRLAKLIILPAQADLAMWGVRGIRFNGTEFVRGSHWSPTQLGEYARANMDADEEDWYPRWGHLRIGLEKWLAYVESHAELSVGDGFWQLMREDRARVGYWKSQGPWEALDLEKYGERRRSASPSVGREGREERRQERRLSPFPCRECRKTK